LFATFISVKPAWRSRRAYEGGAWNEKQFELLVPHFEEPPAVSVPSRLPIETSVRRSRRIDDEKKPAPPSDEATMAMSPTQETETVRGEAPAPPWTKSAGSPMATIVAAVTSQVDQRSARKRIAAHGR